MHATQPLGVIAATIFALTTLVLELCGRKTNQRLFPMLVLSAIVTLIAGQIFSYSSQEQINNLPHKIRGLNDKYDTVDLTEIKNDPKKSYNWIKCSKRNSIGYIFLPVLSLVTLISSTFSSLKGKESFKCSSTATNVLIAVPMLIIALGAIHFAFTAGKAPKTEEVSVSGVNQQGNQHC